MNDRVGIFISEHALRYINHLESAIRGYLMASYVDGLEDRFEGKRACFCFYCS